MDPRLIAAARSPETFKDAEPSPDGTVPAMRGSGERIFGRGGCARCHTPPLYTNNKLTLAEGFTPPGDIPTTLDVLRISVGTDSGLALATRKGTSYYKVPSLRGLWYRSHYLHDASVATLRRIGTRLCPSRVKCGNRGPRSRAEGLVSE